MLALFEKHIFLSLSVLIRFVAWHVTCLSNPSRGLVTCQLQELNHMTNTELIFEGHSSLIFRLEHQFISAGTYMAIVFGIEVEKRY